MTNNPIKMKPPTPASALTTGDLLTRAEAAMLLGCKPDTLRNWTWLGRGPCGWAAGRGFKYPYDEVLRVRELLARGKSIEWADDPPAAEGDQAAAS